MTYTIPKALKSRYNDADVKGLTVLDSISQITHIIGGIMGFIFGITARGRR